MLDVYLASMISDVTDYTRSDYERTVRLYIQPYPLVNKKMTDITTNDIRVLLNQPKNATSKSMQSKIL